MSIGEQQRAQIEQMGLENYHNQTKGTADSLVWTQEEGAGSVKVRGQDSLGCGDFANPSRPDWTSRLWTEPAGTLATG
jgi:hypothetical protein